ncbi:MAG: type II secretion system protein, partial [Planctomycetota bacterium]
MRMTRMTVNMHLHHTEAFLRNRRSRAATIVELLVSISIIAMLIAILTPALRAARTHAHEATSLAHLRSLGVTVSLYASDNNGAAPYAEPGRDTLTWGFENGRQERFVFAPVWSLEVYWPAVVRSVATWRDNFDTWRSPGSAQLGIGRSSVT